MNKCISVEIITDNDNGTVTRRVLTGEQAERWHQMCLSVSIAAENHHCNPDWSRLEWTEQTANKDDQFSWLPKGES